MTYKLCHPDYQNYLYMHYYNNDGVTVDVDNPVQFKVKEFSTHPSFFNQYTLTAPFEGYYFFVGSVYTSTTSGISILSHVSGIVTKNYSISQVYSKASKSFTSSLFMKQGDLATIYFSEEQSLLSAENRHFLKIFGIKK